MRWLLAAGLLFFPFPLPAVPAPVCFPPEKPFDVAVALGLFGGGALFHKIQLNEDHPLLPSDQKSFIPQSVPESYMFAGLAALGPLPFVLEGKKGFLHFRGYLSNAAACFFLYSLVSSASGRRRPNYDDALRLGEKAEKKSFFSGHSTLSFGAATYLSLYLNRTAGSRAATCLASLWLYSLAGYVAYTRYHEHYHHLSDVIAGAAVGTGVSWGVFQLYDKKRRLRLEPAFFPLPLDGERGREGPPAGVKISAAF